MGRLSVSKKFLGGATMNKKVPNGQKAFRQISQFSKVGPNLPNWSSPCCKLGSVPPGEIDMKITITITIIYPYKNGLATSIRSIRAALAKGNTIYSCEIFRSIAEVHLSVLIYWTVSDRLVSKLQPRELNFMGLTAFTGSKFFPFGFFFFF